MSATTPVPDTEAAMVLGIASTAMPFARSPEAQAERWLRILRMHGQAGAALQAVGVSEAPLEAPASQVAAAAATGEPAGKGEPDAPGRGDMVDAVTQHAVRLAADRQSKTVGAADVLLAVMQVYGVDFDRVLRIHGTDRQEVLECLAAHQPEAGPGA